MTKKLLKALIDVSEKASNIARICRRDEHLFSLLVEEKSDDEANPRFPHDFKTLADVLIQETVRHDIGKLFPELRDNICGEESPKMTIGDGEIVYVKVFETPAETAACLVKILDGDDVAAQVLAEEVHRQVSPDNVDEGDLPDVTQIDPKHLGLWIDPIDATTEYIRATFEASTNADIPANGLQCVTVLIGLYDINTGVPVIGVVNQPFAETTADGYKSKIFWGISTESVKLTNVPEIGSSAKPVAILSPSEDVKYIEALESLGFEIVFSAGAGHKLLNVVTGAASVYLLSKATTFKWDTCGPQAILNSLGGVLVNLKEMLKTNQIVEVHYDVERGTANGGGILAVRNREALESVLRALKKAQ